MKTYLVFICCIIISIRTTAQSTFIFDASLQKTRYLIGEPIDLGISITNTDKTQLFQGHLKIRLNNKKNGLLPQSIRAVGDATNRSIKIQPNDDYLIYFDLIDLFGKPINSAPLYFNIPAGEYSLELICSSSDKSEQSKIFQFNVVEPEGDEAIVYNGFINIVSTRYQPDEKVQLLESMTIKYPNSVYMPFLLMVLDICYDIQLKDYQKAYSIRKEIVEKYPYSSISLSMLGGVVKQFPTNAERILFLKQIQSGSKNIIIEKIIEKRKKYEYSK